MNRINMIRHRMYFCIVLTCLMSSSIHSMETQPTTLMQKLINGSKKVFNALKPTPVQQQVMAFMLMNCLIQTTASATVESQWFDYVFSICDPACASNWADYLSQHTNECITIAFANEKNNYIHTALCSSSVTDLLRQENDNIKLVAGYKNVPEVHIVGCISDSQGLSNINYFDQSSKKEMGSEYMH